jgi:hypothetical protein
LSVEETIRALVVGALRDALPELRAELGRPRMLPIKKTPVAYRAILAAEQRGELTVYRIGHSSLVDEADLHEWIRRVGVPRPEQPAAPSDEIGELIELGDERRARRGRRKA